MPRSRRRRFAPALLPVTSPSAQNISEKLFYIHVQNLALVVSTMEKLSRAANAFAVVGLADVVFRLGIEAVDLCSRYRNASKNVPRLVADLKTLADIVAQVRAFVDEYNRSPYMLEDSQVLLPQLETALRDCKRELEELKGVTEDAKNDSNDGWFKRWSKGLIWALDDQKILGSCQQIERYNIVLNTALSLTGR